jgi:hypothetical protein
LAYAIQVGKTAKGKETLILLPIPQVAEDNGNHPCRLLPNFSSSIFLDLNPVKKFWAHLKRKLRDIMGK